MLFGLDLSWIWRTRAERGRLPLGLSVLWGLVFHPVPEKEAKNKALVGTTFGFLAPWARVRRHMLAAPRCQMVSKTLTDAFENEINNVLAAASARPTALDSLDLLSAARGVWRPPPVDESERVLSIRGADPPPNHRPPCRPFLNLLHNYTAPLKMAWLRAPQIPQLLPLWLTFWGVETGNSGCDIPGAPKADTSKYEAPGVQLEPGSLDIRTTFPTLTVCTGRVENLRILVRLVSLLWGFTPSIWK